MSGAYFALKLTHLLSATILLGTGVGTAFAMWRGNKTGDARVIAAVANAAVLADWLFTTPAVIIQPVTGLMLTSLLGYPPTTPWIVASIILYVLVGACWIPVVWLQYRIRDHAQAARDSGQPLPSKYRSHYRLWFALGWPAFAGVIAISWLMVFKPNFWI